jgi:hypothetical protein
VIIHSKSSKKELLKKYKNFDKKIKIKKLYKK